MINGPPQYAGDRGNELPDLTLHISLLKSKLYFDSTYRSRVIARATGYSNLVTLYINFPVLKQGGLFLVILDFTKFKHQFLSSGGQIGHIAGR